MCTVNIKVRPALICKNALGNIFDWIKIYSEGRKSNFLYFIFFVKNNLFALLENDSYKVIVSFIYLFIFLPGEILKEKKKEKEKKMKEERRKEDNFALLLVGKLARPARKKKKTSFFSTTLTGLKFWRNRKQTICAMLVSVHYIEIVPFFFCH